MNYEDFFSPIFVGAFNDATSERVVNQILQEAFVDQTAPITLYIDSDGGFVDALTTIVEVIDTVPNPLRTVCLGRACSAGAILLAHGDERYCGKHSSIMIHELSGGAEGHVKTVVNDTRELARLNKMWMTHLAQNCGIDHETLQARLRKVSHRDLWLDASKAKQFGIIDHVGLPEFALKPRKATPLKRKGRK